MSARHMYAPWACKAVVTQRAALERARDARAGNLADRALSEAFNEALLALSDAEDAHVQATGCTDNH